MRTKVVKKGNIREIADETLTNWKLASYYGMYPEMSEKTGINKKSLRDAILHGMGTEETEAAINGFFKSKQEAAA